MQVKYAMVEPGEGLVYHVDQRHEALGSHKDHHGEQSRRRRECDLPEPPPIPQLCRHELHRHQLHRRDRHHLHLHPPAASVGCSTSATMGGTNPAAAAAAANCGPTLAATCMGAWGRTTETSK